MYHRRPMRGALVFLVVVTGCMNPSRGRFPSPGGARPDDVRDGEVAFTLDAGEWYWRPHRVVEHNDHQVLFSDFASYKWITPLREVVTPSQIRAGDWFNAHGPRVGARETGDKCETKAWLIATAATPETVSATCNGGEWTWAAKDVSLPRANLVRDWGLSLAICIALAASGAWLFVFLRRRWRRARDRIEDAEWQSMRGGSARLAQDDSSATAHDSSATAHAGRLAVLRCPQCDDVVALAAESSRCKACGATVPIPPEYRRLVHARDEAARTAPAEAAALRRARLVTGKATGVALLAFAVAGWVAWSLALAHGVGIGLGWGASFAIRVAPLLVAGMAAAILLGGGRLARIVAPLAAPRDEKQRWLCRACGAPLGPDTDGLVHCDYCRAQNMIDDRLAAGARVAEQQAGSQAATIAAATAVFWNGLWRIWSIPGMVVGLACAIVTALFAVVYAVFLIA